MVSVEHLASGLEGVPEHGAIELQWPAAFDDDFRPWLRDAFGVLFVGGNFLSIAYTSLVKRLTIIFSFD